MRSVSSEEVEPRSTSIRWLCDCDLEDRFRRFKRREEGARGKKRDFAEKRFVADSWIRVCERIRAIEITEKERESWELGTMRLDVVRKYK